ncbi:MAG: alkaline phosphatase family protein [Clostridiaceae bacterium]|nr:alkaline phosphatase family protein [Clostridiaceae bacterium]
MKKRILVFSVDSMVCEDVDAIREMSNFRKYFANCCEVVGGMRTIYPSVTYPIHVTLMTGCYAGKHGVTSNFKFTTTNKDGHWLWFSDAIRVKNIFTAAKEKGYSTAAISWPVTAGLRDVDWLMPEYWMPKPGDTLRSSFADAGSSKAMLDIIERNAKYLPEGYEKGGKKNFMKWPQVDEFIIHVTCDVIREYAPEVTFVHTGTFDHFRHSYGVFSKRLDEARANLDRYIGELMHALEDAGMAGQTNIVLTSDHGQRDICRVVNLNVLLADNGFIDAEPDGTVKDWRAYCLSNAMSSSVFLSDPSDESLKKAVYECLKKLQDEGVYGIGRIYTAEEAWEEERLKGDFSFVIESDGYTSFGDRAVRPLVQNFDVSDYRFGRATHGYMPDYGPQPVFLAKGPDFKKNVKLERGRIIDEAPTFAKLLGVELPEADGTAMDALLK